MSVDRLIAVLMKASTPIEQYLTTRLTFPYRRRLGNLPCCLEEKERYRRVCQSR